ncbi:hypothetical protein [Ferruginibacter sp. SUN106]|uniref:hypothetical protein n=1 Tax=Ferruginibacter sp. SUN106 TaxID=2978348 RepID=UPI003D35BF84
MDEFKKYLQEHKDEMDVDTPSAGLLQRIQTQTAAKKKNTLYPLLLRISAAACMLVIIGFGIKWLLTKNKTGEKIVNAPSTPQQKIPEALRVTIDTTTNKNIAAEKNTIAALTPEKNTGPKKMPEPYQLMRSFEYNYTQLVKLQLKNIRQTPVYGETPDYFNDFKQTLQQIDTDEAIIKKNIRSNGLSDILLEQLINVYQEKINVLKNLQQEMNKINNKVRENQLPADTLKSHYINI